MPQHQRHRGQHPRDAELFSPAHLPRLRAAVADYSWLLTRGYAETSALQIVGNRYALTVRQRQAVARSGCSDQAMTRRLAHRAAPEEGRGHVVHIDGYNLLISVECALSGGILLRGRDGCIRDLASIHGSYRRIDETLPALRCIGDHLLRLGVTQARWYLDAPVSNSGRLKTLLELEAEVHAWAWQAQTVPDPDRALASCGGMVITSDSGVLDAGVRWLAFTESLLACMTPPPPVVDLNPAQ